MFFFGSFCGFVRDFFGFLWISKMFLVSYGFEKKDFLCVSSAPSEKGSFKRPKLGGQNGAFRKGENSDRGPY